MSEELKPLACPFCGDDAGLDFDEGSTFRWMLASCKSCGANCGEVRVQTKGRGTPEQWQAKAKLDAIIAWNTRTPPEGMVTVPVEPNEETQLAMTLAVYGPLMIGPAMVQQTLRHYRAMIAAAKEAT